MTFSQYQVYLGVTVGSIIYSCMVLIVALSDTRFWFYRLSKSSRIIDEMIMNMDKRINSIESSNNSDENAMDFKKECKDFMIEYKTFIGTTNTLDVKTELDKKIKSRSASHPRSSPNIPQSAHGRVREVITMYINSRSFMSFVMPTFEELPLLCGWIYVFTYDDDDVYLNRITQHKPNIIFHM
jgi:hypothetical protein